MSEQIKDGGSAFPGRVGGGYPSGMSLRDYFAAKAFQSLLLSSTSGVANAEWTKLGAAKAGKSADQFLAEMCYQLADAMIAARDRR